MSVSRVQWPAAQKRWSASKALRAFDTNTRRTAGPPAIRGRVRKRLRVACVRAAAELGRGDVGHAGHVNLGDPLLHLGRVDGRNAVECRVVGGENGVVCEVALVSARNDGPAGLAQRRSGRRPFRRPPSGVEAAAVNKRTLLKKERAPRTTRHRKRLPLRHHARSGRPTALGRPRFPAFARPIDPFPLQTSTQTRPEGRVTHSPAEEALLSTQWASRRPQRS